MRWFRKASRQQPIAPPPSNEGERLQVLKSLQILDSDSEAEFDEIALQAAFLCDTPIALISLIDSDRLWFKSTVGLDICETSRDTAFCPHAILNPLEPMIVPDAKQDSRFARNPLVVGAPYIRFYAGFSLITSEGLPLGTLCVIDVAPKELSPEQITGMQFLARQVSFRLETRQQLRDLEQRVHELEGGRGWVGYNEKIPPRGAWLWVYDGNQIYSMRSASSIIKATHWMLNSPPPPPQ